MTRVKHWRNMILKIAWLTDNFELLGGDLWKISVVHLRVNYNNQVLI